MLSTNTRLPPVSGPVYLNCIVANPRPTKPVTWSVNTFSQKKTNLEIKILKIMAIQTSFEIEAICLFECTMVYHQAIASVLQAKRSANLPCILGAVVLYNSWVVQNIQVWLVFPQTDIKYEAIIGCCTKDVHPRNIYFQNPEEPPAEIDWRGIYNISRKIWLVFKVNHGNCFTLSKNMM